MEAEDAACELAANADARARVNEIFRRLTTLEPAALGAEELTPEELPFTSPRARAGPGGPPRRAASARGSSRHASKHAWAAASKRASFPPADFPLRHPGGWRPVCVDHVAPAEDLGCVRMKK